MPLDLLTTLTQFGAAGVIAGMWLTERRNAAAREERLTEAHRALLDQRLHLDMLLRVISDNTRALTGLEAGHRRLADLLERFAGAFRPAVRPPPRSAPAERAPPTPYT